MSRPKVICHMHTLLNGKVDGHANITSRGLRAQRVYFDIMLGQNRYYTKHRGWMTGRGTSEASLGGPREPELPTTFDPVPEGDFIAQPDAPIFNFAVDGSGKLAWERDTVSYFELDAPIVSLISGSVGDAYKAYLRERGISYIIAGQDRLDLAQVVRKIGDIFDTDELMLGGGPHLNWSMLRAGLVDELSLVLMPTADAEPDTHSLFEADERFTSPVPFNFDLISAEPMDDGSVWLRYDVKGEIAGD